MNAPVLKGFVVRLHHRGGPNKGRVTVQATCEKHAERVAVDQVIEISYPKTKPGNWVVDGVEAKAS